MNRSLAQIDLNLLYTFRVFVETGSVGQAARRLGRSQPAVSVRLRQLEAALGTNLFERIGRRLELTPVGRAVDREARALLDGVVRLVDQVRGHASRPTGLLRVGVLPTVGVYLVAPVVAELVRRYASVAIEL